MFDQLCTIQHGVFVSGAQFSANVRKVMTEYSNKRTCFNSLTSAEMSVDSGDEEDDSFGS